MNEQQRQQELVMKIADYLTDWTDDETSIVKIEDSIEIIESYGVKFDAPCDDLVINAVSHLDNVMNLWNKAAVPQLLEDIGFTNEEILRYYQITEPIIWLQFGQGW